MHAFSVFLSKRRRWFACWRIGAVLAMGTAQVELSRIMLLYFSRYCLWRQVVFGDAAHATGFSSRDRQIISCRAKLFSLILLLLRGTHLKALSLVQRWCTGRCSDSQQAIFCVVFRRLNMVVRDPWWMSFSRRDIVPVVLSADRPGSRTLKRSTCFFFHPSTCHLLCYVVTYRR